MVEAAGGVIWRVNSKGELTVLLVHRPRYDDWTFPKGKLHDGESWSDGALREVHEETGLRCELGPQLVDVRYEDRKGRPKRVRYWAMHVLGGRFRKNHEVDETEWMTPRVAAERLSYDRDLPLLAALQPSPSQPTRRIACPPY